MTRRYELPDEPRPGPGARTVVAPFWPLLGSMLGGVWLGWPWFVWNGFAMGSPTRRREALIAILGLLGAPLLLAVTVIALRSAGIELAEVRSYVLLSIVLWKLAIAYWLFSLQNRTFELYRHYGGPVAVGLPVVALGFFGEKWVGSALRSVSPILEFFLT